MKWDALLAVTIIPIGMFGLVLLAVTLAKCAAACAGVCKSKTSDKSGDDGGAGGVSLRKNLGYFMTGILLVLPTISRRVCQMFRCNIAHRI